MVHLVQVINVFVEAYSSFTSVIDVPSDRGL